MMKKPAIGFDLDDTIIDHRGNRRKLAEKYGLNLSDTELYLLKEQNVPSETVAALKGELYGECSRSAEPVEGSRATLASLSEQYDLYIISRRHFPENAPEHARYWIETHLPFISMDNVHFTLTHDEKVPLAHSFSVTAFVDDHPKVLGAFDRTVRRILFDPFDLHRGTTYERVRGWEEVGQKFLERLPI